MFAYLKANAQNMVLKNQTSFMSKESSFMSFSVKIIYPRIHPIKQSCLKVKSRIRLSPKIRLIDGNAKCRRLKKLTCKGTLRQVFICLMF
jgi:hypothetical protein